MNPPGRPAPMSPSEFLGLVNEASRAPSVHNIQPAKFRLAGAGLIEIHADPARTLPVGDPSGVDVRVSLGASCEGLAIALGRRGLKVVEVMVDEPTREHTRAAVVRYERSEVEDNLARAVFRRSTWRGLFEPADAARLAMLQVRIDEPAVTVALDQGAIELAVQGIDGATAETALGPETWRETWSWLRLSPRDPGWGRDGLNAESLALSPFEAAGARWLMRPGALGRVRSLGLDRFLVSEAALVKSASALIVLTAPAHEDAFAAGRRFYRTWLQVTALGLSLCPMSALVESQTTATALRQHLKIPAAHRLVNVLRVGKAPRGSGRLTPRLPAKELVLS